MLDDEPGATPLVEALLARGRYGDSLQKLCDAADWTDPRFLMAVRRGLGLRPRIHARQWEQTAAFLALAEAGKLDGRAEGLGFGCGREPLTYALAARAGRVVATDLYDSGASWINARTDDPRAMILAGAPPGLDPAKLDARRMDMRRVEYPDASFDFCWSISAFEHIGGDDDFLAHLREARRVMRPGGLYALTTEVLLGEESRATRGNYAFAAAHLLRLMAEAGLQAAPVVDMRLSDWGENVPKALVGTRHHDPAEGLIQGLTLRERAGVMSAPVLFLLRAAEGAPRPVRIEGLAETRRAAEAQRRAQIRQRFADWVRLNPLGSRPRRKPVGWDLWSTEPARAPARFFATAFFDFDGAAMEIQATVAPSPQMPKQATIELALQAWRPGGEAAERVAVETATLNARGGGSAVVRRFAFTAEPGLAYNLAGQVKAGAALVAAVDVQARRRPG